jgi:ABC-2 type transport system permease protein
VTLVNLRARGALRSLAARPVWLAVTGVLLVLGTYGGYRLVHHGVTWLHGYPLIDSIAPAITQRSLEGFFLMLMAAVLFSVLIASIGTLYGSADLELLLALPTSPLRIFSMKVTELFINAAGMPLIFTLPVLIGVGAALGARPLYYPVSVLAAVALYALPVALGALLALLLVRISPVGRVREVATAVSISVAAAALLGLRALRPEQLFTLNAANEEAFERFLTGFARLEIGWLPPAWATNASWAALDGQLHAGFAALLAVGLAGLALTGLLAQLAYRRGWVRSLDTTPARRARPARPAPLWERLLTSGFGTVGAIISRDARIFFRDVQQWSQLLVLFALAGVYFVSLAAIPVPTQQFRDVLGMLNVAFVSFITAGVALRIAYPSVSYEAAAYWLTQVSPIRKRDLVLAKFLFTLPIMLVLSLALGLAARFLLDLSPILALAAPLAAVSSAVALTGLAVGVGAAHPRFRFTNPNELAMTPGAFIFMVLAFAYSAVITLLLARPAWNAISQPGNTQYWSSPEGLLILVALARITLITAGLPLLHGTRHLQRTEH